MIRATFKTRPTRVLGFDLESRPSAFWFDGRTTAEITAFGWKWTDEDEAHTMVLCADGTLLSETGESLNSDDGYLSFAAQLAAADLIYGHNIRAFDLPLLNAGLLRRGLPQLPRLLTTDTLRDYPRRKDMSASLENLAKMYGLDEKGKLHMAIVDWERANRLEQDGVEAARARVSSDVLLQERLRARLLELGLLKPPRAWTP